MFLGDLDYSCTRNLQETMFEIIQAAIEIAYVFCRFLKAVQVCRGLRYWNLALVLYGPRFKGGTGHGVSCQSLRLVLSVLSP